MHELKNVYPDRALEAFSIAGSIISMIGLILTIITMVGFR